MAWLPIPGWVLLIFFYPLETFNGEKLCSGDAWLIYVSSPLPHAYVKGEGAVSENEQRNKGATWLAKTS